MLDDWYLVCVCVCDLINLYMKKPQGELLMCFKIFCFVPVEYVKKKISDECLKGTVILMFEVMYCMCRLWKTLPE